MIDDESLVKTRTNTCLSYASAIPSYSVVVLFPKVGKCNQTNDTYTFKQSKILQISLQLRIG